ncbi:MAG: hypothetical protein MI924_18165, partial [Chloroflexales bacterium]|nr:hypothetical protein [Chloroflexales bacterium]
LHFAAGISMGTARRYWYGTRDGTENGEPMTTLDLLTIEKVAQAIGVSSWKDLVEDWLARRGADRRNDPTSRRAEGEVVSIAGTIGALHPA